MQLLQKLRDSASMTRYAERISVIEEKSRKLAGKILDFLSNEWRKQLLIAYDRQGYLASSILYWFVTTMDPEKKVFMGDANTISYFVVAYREPGTVLFLSTNPSSGSAINLLQSSTLMGNKLLFVTIKPKKQELLDIYSRYNHVYVDSNDELEASLLLSMAIYHAASRIYRGSLGRRGKRLYIHSEEGFTPIVQELVEKYLGELEEAVSRKQVIVTSTRILEPAAMYFVESLRRIGINAHYEMLEQVIGPSNVLFLATSVEEYYVREIQFKLGLMNVSYTKIIMNTDPLEAQIYYAIMAYYLVHSAGQDTGGHG